MTGEESDDHADRAPAQAGSVRPGHCRSCAQQADLLDHYHRVQQEEDSLRATQQSAAQAHRTATRALWASGIGLLPAAIALLTG